MISFPSFIQKLILKPSLISSNPLKIAERI